MPVLTQAMTTIVVSGEKRSGKTTLARLLCAASGSAPVILDCSSSFGCGEARSQVPESGPVVFDNVDRGWLDAMIAAGNERSGFTVITTGVTDRMFRFDVAAHYQMDDPVSGDGPTGHLWVSPDVRS